MPLIPSPVLGECKYPTPIKSTVRTNLTVPKNLRWRNDTPPEDPERFEAAGPQPKLFFDPAKTTAAIVTCGGLCPGLNNVIRSLVLQLYHGYGVHNIIGFRNGYQGLDPTMGAAPLVLTPDVVEDIHKKGGTILGTSRGPVNTNAAVDNLLSKNVDILFTIGGDGTQRGSKVLYDEAQRRGRALSVVGIPKTIDNDIPYVSRTFGYLTAIEEASEVISRAHTEVHSVPNGIAIVKLMGRHAGFIALNATIASQDVNFCLIPEVPFQLEGKKGLLKCLRTRIEDRAHAVIVVAEGAGQNLLKADASERDASGNVKLKDIGLFLKEQIEGYFKKERLPMVMRYIDPSYLIRSCRADAEDAILCDLFARHAVHAAMAGRTGIIIGRLHEAFAHIPITLLANEQKRVDPNGTQWYSALASTGQPHILA